MRTVKTKYIKVTQGDSHFYLVRLSAANLAAISYASVRGIDDEEGAVQRLLNARRISSIKDFTLTVGQFPASIVLNWIDPSHNISEQGDLLHIPIKTRSAQLIDGQHRVEGIREAIEERKDISKLQLPVAIYRNLTTRQCANIFLSINTEQKPVPRTLVYDLYGIADEELVDAAAARARDIAIALNENDDSPYREQIKFPASPRRKGGIALATAVTALKPLVEGKGDFEQRNTISLETQTKIIINFFSSIRSWYGERWLDGENAFMFAAGFVGAVEFFRTKMISYCQDRKSFTRKTMSAAFKASAGDLILQSELKGKAGRDAATFVQDRLTELFIPELDGDGQFEV